MTITLTENAVFWLALIVVFLIVLITVFITKSVTERSAKGKRGTAQGFRQLPPQDPFVIINSISEVLKIVTVEANLSFMHQYETDLDRFWFWTGAVYQYMLPERP